MTPNAIALVTRPLAANASAHPYDVLKMKSILAALGHYEAPEWGLSQFPDPSLFGALRTFQEKRGLKVDGVMKPGGETEETLLSTLNVGQAGTAIRAAATALQEMGRGGDEILAHITPEEAQLLDAITDGASVNPHTGLLEFAFDASAYHKGNQSSASSGSSSRTGGGNDRGSGMRDRRYTDRQRAGEARANQEAARTREKVRQHLGRNKTADGNRRDEHHDAPEIQVAEARTPEQKEYERYMRQFYKDYRYGGNNLGTGYNNPAGMDGSAKALLGATVTKGAQHGGRTLRANRQKHMRVIGKGAESYGDQLEEKFSAPTYDPHDSDFYNPDLHFLEKKNNKPKNRW